MKNSKFMKATVMLFTMILFIGSTFAENIDREANGDNGGGVWMDQFQGNWDNHNASVWAYIYMDVLDDAGNDAAYLSVTVNRSYYGEWVWANGNEIDAVEYSASACVYSAGWEGKANAWVQVPQAPEAPGAGRDQQRGDIGGAGEPSSVSAYKSAKRDKGGINVNGKRKVTASCRAWEGGIAANIKLVVSEF
jgi:hypothetical protein